MGAHPKKNKKKPSQFFGWYSNPKFKYQKKPKNPKKTKKTKKTNGVQKTSFQFRMLAKAYAKKPKKAIKTKKNSFQFRKKKTKKKTNANLEIKKKKQKNECQLTDFGVATGFFLVFLGEHPPKDVRISDLKRTL